MTGKNLLIASLTGLLAVALLALAFQLGRGRDEKSPEKVQGSLAEQRASLEGIEDRLRMLEGEVAALRVTKPAAGEEGAVDRAREADVRLAAIESGVSSLQLRVKGLEEDPIRRGYSFMESENAEMRREGINSLARVARFDPSARAAIRKLLGDPSARVREQAAQVLRNLKDKDSAPEMKTLLADADARTRRRAVQALGAIEARDAVPEIGRNLMTDADDRVRETAADVLGILKSREAEGFLIEALKDRNEVVRGEAIASLGEIGAVSAAPQLRALYEGEPGAHRIRLALALKGLGDDAPLQKEIGRLSEIVKSDAEPAVRQRAQRELDVLMKGAAP
jgi:HEAT repeat protein